MSEVPLYQEREKRELLAGRLLLILLAVLDQSDADVVVADEPV